MSVSTDEMYNSDSRFLHAMYRIHFSSGNILEVTKEDYLLDSSILEESYKLSDSPFGEVTSNELSLLLYSEEGLFNPENKSSPYSSLIRKGIKIEAFIRPDEVTEWDDAGVFYVADWVTSSGSASATVTAYDALYGVLNASVPSMPVYRNVSVKTFARDYFALFGIDAIVDDGITETIPYVYTSGFNSNKDFLGALMMSITCDCFCNHSGRVVIKCKDAGSEARAVFTDDDQIISIDVKQSITASHDSAIVEYLTCSEGAAASVLSIPDLSVVKGSSTTNLFSFSSTPVTRIVALSTSVKSISRTAGVTGYSASASDISITIVASEDLTVSVDVQGTTLETAVGSVGYDGDSPLKLSSAFIQNEAAALKVYGFARRYVTASTPTLDLTVRGNPKLELGDKIVVDSNRTGVQYTGTIIKANYKYVGSLSCTITLAKSIEEVL